MAIYKIFPEKSATLYSFYPTLNTGLDEILEVSVKNSDELSTIVTAETTSDDLRRSIVQFSSTDLSKIAQYATGSWKAYLKLYVANAENLSKTYSLEFRQVSQSWGLS